jgi:peptidoglycan/LPS O-acetylase OafA/YrhL/lysophospholipase L1-like esterase
MSDRRAERPALLESANLDLLVGAAVSLVVVSNVALYFGWTTHKPGFGRPDVAWASLGYWGVLALFVHDVAARLRSMERLAWRIEGGGLFATFMVRCWFRLLPLSVLAVGVVAGLHLPVGHLRYGQFLPVPSRAVDVVANLLLIQNLTNVESLEAPLWPLPFVMQMAVVLPVLFGFVRREAGFHRSLALWVAAFVLGVAWERHRIFQMPAYLPCFLAGVVAFKAQRRGAAWPHWLWPATIVVFAVLYVRNPSLLSGWASCLALGLLFPQFAEMPEGVLRRGCLYVARYAYAIYLSHFVLIWFAFVRLAALPEAARIAIFSGLLVAVPVALYHFVQAPLLRLGSKVSARFDVGSLRVRLVHAATAGALVFALVAFVRTAAAKRSAILGTVATPHGSPVHLVGRFDLRDPRGPRFAWPGSTIRSTFAGTGLDIRLRDEGTNFLSVVVDRGPPIVLATVQGTHDYAVASNLAPGPHEVVVIKRTEASVGVMQYLGVTPHEGSLRDSADEPARRIEYVGDSITCGYGDRGPVATCPFSPETEDETLSYAALAADALGAQATVLAFSGQGMYRDDEGSTVHPMPELFLRTLPYDASSLWSFDEPAPDAVVIGLGTNDYEPGEPGPAFEQAYVTFLRDLRAHYPRAYLIGTLSPMLSDANPSGAGHRTAAAAWILGAVRERKASGDARVAYLAFDEQTASAGYGCDGHPSATTHRLMTTKLVATLRALLGW